MTLSRLFSALGALLVVAALSIPSALAGEKRVTVYKSPQCGCCGGWVDYMRNAGYSVRVKEMEDVTPIKEFLGVNEELWSCHTAVIDNYVIEGHVTLQAIESLLSRRPDNVRGIALPGMPQGSPGMSGVKDEDWTTYTISDSEPTVFMVE
ncbi:MAG: DUF411 domain-containing protein [Rhodospirillales bacterium]|nr:DUF411 domain-containing protein [Rhodospirillales bacterium]